MRKRTDGAEGLERFLTELEEPAVRVIAEALYLTGGLDRALEWFRSHPIRDLDYKTPESLVSEGKAEAVIRYIESLGAGASG